MTTQEQLDQVNAAISAILQGAQEYTIGSRRIRRADLQVLFEERRRLEAALAHEKGFSTTVAVFDRR
ncbi:MAG TPA: peptidylprolyl isomerase [Syntrophomonadaceae bacterium]|jgi:hypothetical protein|nr:peptidylprolyl isomerase [Syntrophomonadaceae bacterium]HQE23735.1 peptidylprolyl isomerase [Syntrophomonadaceae bacterium]